MSTLAVGAPRAPKLWAPLRAFTQVITTIGMVIEVFGEAQNLAYDVRRRYPFMTW